MIINSYSQDQEVAEEPIPDSSILLSLEPGATETLETLGPDESNSITEKGESFSPGMDDSKQIPDQRFRDSHPSPVTRTPDSTELEEDVIVSTKDVMVSPLRRKDSQAIGGLPTLKSEKLSSGRGGSHNAGSLLDSNSEEVRNYLDLDTYGCYARVRGVWFHAKTLRLLSGSRSIHEVLLVDYDEIHEIQSSDLVNHYRDISLEDKVDSCLVEKLRRQKLSTDDALLVAQFKIEKSEYDIKKSWEAGKKCLAVWSEDSIWYNAIILENDKVFKRITVRFTDYGNDDIVSYNNVVANFNCITDIGRIDPYILSRGDYVPEAERTNDDGPNLRTSLDVSVNQHPVLTNSLDCFKTPTHIFEPSESSVSAISEIQDSVSVTVNSKVNFLSLPGILKKKFEISNVAGPVGVVVLPGTEIILVACRTANRVLKFSRNGDCIGSLMGKRSLSQPTDLRLMKSGNILLRDGSGIQMFDSQCEFVKNIGDVQINKYLGLAESEDHIITINSNSGGTSHGIVTEAGKTDIFYFNKLTGDLDLRVIMDDIIGERKDSNLTSVAYDDGRLYVVDMMDNRIYCLSIEEGEDQARVFEDTQVLDKPSCMIVDDYGTMMITDSGSNRLLLFETNLKYCGDVKVGKVLNYFEALVQVHSSPPTSIITWFHGCIQLSSAPS